MLRLEPHRYREQETEPAPKRGNQNPFAPNENEIVKRLRRENLRFRIGTGILITKLGHFF